MDNSNTVPEMCIVMWLIFHLQIHVNIILMADDFKFYFLYRIYHASQMLWDRRDHDCMIGIPSDGLTFKDQHGTILITLFHFLYLLF
jgi:hypothetical protein